jgi:hypothetical protein
MRTLIVSALMSLTVGMAHAQSDVKRLAQFDLGFARCETRFDYMKGHRDEAYLALWKVKLSAERRAALDKQRKSKTYQQERIKAQKSMAADSPALDEKIRNQCSATWSEVLRNRQPVAASAPAPKK